jgi:hypothetical protein
LAETEAKGEALNLAMKAKDIAQMRTIPADQITNVTEDVAVPIVNAPRLTWYYKLSSVWLLLEEALLSA